MPHTSADFTLRDLQQWIEDAVAALEKSNWAPGPNGDLRRPQDYISFEVTLAAAICLAVPGVELTLIAPVQQQETPRAYSIFVACVDQMGYHRGRFTPMSELAAQRLASCREMLHAAGEPADDLQVEIHPPVDPSLQSYGNPKWRNFLCEHIAAQFQAQVLARATIPATAKRAIARI